MEGGWGVFKSQFKPSEPGRYKLVLDAPKQNRKARNGIDSSNNAEVEEIGQADQSHAFSRKSPLSAVVAPSLMTGLEQVVQQISVAPEPKDLEKRIRIWSSPWWGALDPGAALRFTGLAARQPGCSLPAAP